MVGGFTRVTDPQIAMNDPPCSCAAPKASATCFAIRQCLVHRDSPAREAFGEIFQRAP
jgi:hypothetical protein